MALRLFSVKDTPVPEVGEAQAALDTIDARTERLNGRAAVTLAKAEEFEREAATLRAVGEEVVRIQQELAAEKSRQATFKVDGTAVDTRHLVHLRNQLTVALGRKVEADTDADIAEEAAAGQRKDFAALQADIRVLHDQRAEAVRQVLLERLRDAAPAFEELRRQVVAEYIRIFSLAAAHDKLASALKAGQFVGGVRGGDLRLPFPEGFSEVLDLNRLHVETEAAAITLLRELKVHA